MYCPVTVVVNYVNSVVVNCVAVNCVVDNLAKDMYIYMACSNYYYQVLLLDMQQV